MKNTVIALSMLIISGLSFTACQHSSTQQSTNKATQYVRGSHLPTNVEKHFIPMDTANKMIQSYLTSIASGENANKQLQSLIVDAEVLREYLKDTSIKNLKVLFAHTLNYINSGHYGQNAGYHSNALTIVFAGYDSKGNYIFATGQKVPDQAVPCPANCPHSGTAANPLLQ